MIAASNKSFDAGGTTGPVIENLLVTRLRAAASTQTVSAHYTAMAVPLPTIVYATRSGGKTIDQDAFGGNPFATALIEVSERPSLPLRRLLPALRSLTLERTARFQEPTWSLSPDATSWRFPLEPGSRNETRIALVLVVSDYSAWEASPLTGAAIDERRVSAMLAHHGFTVMQGVVPTRAQMLLALREFSRRSTSSEVALIYATGHGVEGDGQTYLLPGNYPIRRGYSAQALGAHALPISELAEACRANAVNLAFFAGCRNRIVRER